MLSVSKPIRGAGQGEYYLSLAREDYYLDTKGEPPGYWIGQGAAAFGLTGTIVREEFRNLLSGFTPDGETALVRNAGSPRRRSGWDLTWSVPKSVSVAWSQAPLEVRAQIEAAVRDAVSEGVAYLETVGAVSRRGEDGVIRDPARLVFTGFPHSTSRGQDPQLHIHTILHNVALRPDGSTGTVEPRELFRHQVAAGTLFRTELSAQLDQRLGLRTRKHGRSFELIGVDPALIAEFSKRRAEIEAALAERGLSGGKAAEVAALNTRKPKEAISRDELFRRWQAVGREFHWSAKELSWLIHAPYPARDPGKDSIETTGNALANLTNRVSHFSARELTQALAEEGQTRSLPAKRILEIRDDLLASPELVRLREKGSEVQWTTQEMLKVERALFAAADAMHRRERPVLTAGTAIQRVLPKHPELSEEQRQALAHVCETAGGLRVVSGMAGTGKSTLFAAAATVWAAQGREVHGACLAGKAARGLEEATRIPSQTIHRTIQDLAARRLKLTPQSVLLVDEAAMVGTRQLHTLVEASRKAGSTLVLCGDAGQLQAIEAGGAFAALSKRYGAAELTEIHRQREAWAREAVQEFAAGRGARALFEFDRRGQLALSDDPLRAISDLVEAWSEEGLCDPQHSLMLAGTNGDVAALNALAQSRRLAAGLLSGPSLEVSGQPMYQGDRVVFTRNSIHLAVFNGDTGTVKVLTDRLAVVRLDDGRSIEFDPSHYPHLRLAYCLTTHKAQGLTTEKAFVLLGGGMQDRETTYVQASRARGATYLHSAETFVELAAKTTRSRPKTLATEHLAIEPLSLVPNR